MNEFDLTGEYFQAYFQVEKHARTYGFTGKKYDEAMQNLLDVLYTAQQNNRAVEMIIGYDIERFTKNYFSEYTIKDDLNNYLSLFNFSMVIFFSFALYDFVRGEVKINIISWITLLMSCIVILLFAYLKRKFNCRKTLTCAMVVSIFYVLSLRSIEVSVPTIYPLIICGLWTLVYGCLWLFNQFKHR